MPGSYRKGIVMVKSKISGLPVNQELLMQIFDVVVDQLEDTIAVRHQYIFKMHVFDKVNLMYLGEIEEVILDGCSAYYIVDFVETATDDDIMFGFTDLRYSIGAVFVGIITAKTVANCHNHKKTFYNVVPLRHLIYMKEGEKIMVQKPSKLKIDTKYWMQIVKAYEGYGNNESNLHRYVFGVRIWPDKNDLTEFYDVKESYSNLGKSAQELQTFVEAITDTEVDINELELENLVGVVFKGMIGKRIFYDQYGPTIYYDLKVLVTYGVCEIEGGEVNARIFRK